MSARRQMTILSCLVLAWMLVVGPLKGAKAADPNQAESSDLKAQVCQTDAEVRGHVVAGFLRAQEQAAIKCDQLNAQGSANTDRLLKLYGQMTAKFQTELLPHQKAYDAHFHRAFGKNWEAAKQKTEIEFDEKMKKKLNANMASCFTLELGLKVILANPWSFLQGKLDDGFAKERPKVPACK